MMKKAQFPMCFKELRMPIIGRSFAIIESKVIQ